MMEAEKLNPDQISEDSAVRLYAHKAADKGEHSNTRMYCDDWNSLDENVARQRCARVRALHSVQKCDAWFAC